MFTHNADELIKQSRMEAENRRVKMDNIRNELLLCFNIPKDSILAKQVAKLLTSKAIEE